jgi:hypothetical protein
MQIVYNEQLLRKYNPTETVQKELLKIHSSEEICFM